MNPEPLEHSLQQYRELCRRVDEKFHLIQSNYSAQFQCAHGCHTCCKPNLTVSPLEKESIQRVLIANAFDPTTHPSYGPERCGFLDVHGNCVIYEVRPLVCRSHGAPLEMRSLENQEEKIRDACPLNFSDGSLGTIPPCDVINADTIHTLLSLLNQRAFGKTRERYPLTPRGILSPGGKRTKK